MTLLLIALGAFFFAELFKTALPFQIEPWFKLALAWAGAVLISVVLDVGYDHVHAHGPYVLAGIGGAMVVHKLHRLLSALGDAQRVQMISTAAARRR
jgi:ABC-type Fe3+-siderophore transport system permease subunit